ncbi:MAG TPA: hypothetical protein VMI31_05305 [Fimbriimonadaceae bacterium]|nr:hypothetical protein [Fimbriimonadaceae bacterium]
MKPAILTLLAAVLLCGCSGEGRILGDWYGKFVKENGETVPGANLTFEDHHHWRELYGNEDIEGRWQLSGNQIVMHIELFNNLLVPDAKKYLLSKANESKKPAEVVMIANSLDKPIDLTISADGKSLTRADPGQQGTAVYTRQPPPPAPIPPIHPNQTIHIKR